MDNSKDKIEEAFENPEIITEALSKAAQSALRKHQQAGVPVIIWRNGKPIRALASELLDEDKPLA